MVAALSPRCVGRNPGKEFDLEAEVMGRNYRLFIRETRVKSFLGKSSGSKQKEWNQEKWKMSDWVGGKMGGEVRGREQRGGQWEWRRKKMK